MAAVPLLTSAEASGKAAEALAGVEARGRVLPVLRAVANAQSAFPAFLRYSASLVFTLDLPPRLRELVIMRAASHLRSRYEWGEHYDFARTAGVSDDDLRTLAAGELPGSLSPLERDALALTDAILDRAASDAGAGADRAALAVKVQQQLGDRQFAELALVVGWWAGCVPAMVDLLGLEEEAPTVAVGW